MPWTSAVGGWTSLTLPTEAPASFLIATGHTLAYSSNIHPFSFATLSWLRENLVWLTWSVHIETPDGKGCPAFLAHQHLSGCGSHHAGGF